MSVNERVAEVIKTKFGGNKRAFAQQIGVSATVVENIVGKRQGKPSFDVAVAICANANISAEWLLTGEGEMARKAEDTQSSKPLEEDAVPLISGQNHLIDVIRQQAEEIGTLKEKLRNAEKSTRRNSEDS